MTPNKIDRVNGALRDVATRAEELEIAAVIRPAQGERHDVIDVPLLTKISTTPCVRAPASLLVEQPSYVDYCMPTESPRTPCPTASTFDRVLFKIGLPPVDGDL